MKNLIQNIRYGDRVLYLTGLSHLILAVLFICLSFADSRVVNHENIWMKPFKFSVSIAMFTWTYAWFSRFYTYKRFLMVLNRIIAICMVLEIILITMQATRGVASHFNISTPFDAMVFSVMGGIIGFNAVIIAIHFGLFVLFEKGGGKYRSSIIWGMLLFLIGNFSGYLMIRYFTAIPAAADVIQGMPVTNWKPGSGDLRIAHFMGLHAIQVLPLAAFLLKHYRVSASAIHAVGILYLFLIGSALTYPVFIAQ